MSTGSNAFAIKIVCGGDHSCALLHDGSIVCWGLNSNGQLGIGNTVDQYSPKSVSFNQGIPRLPCTCATFQLRIEAVVQFHIWNLNRGSYSLTKSILYPGKSFIAKNLAAGMAHTCAILIDDRVMCWGLNNRGQLGISNVNHTLAPFLEVSGIPSGRGSLINGCFYLFWYSTSLMGVSLDFYCTALIFKLYLPSVLMRFWNKQV